MCSVRQRPMPSAPKSRARRASSGVSAFVRTFSTRALSAQSSTRMRYGLNGSGCVTGAAPANTWPLVPSMVMTSPTASVVLPSVMVSPEMCSASTPHTAGRPMPTATTAAWLVLPPRAVMMPLAAIMPCRSSGVVSSRTRMTASPASPRRSASSAVSTMAPVAAPGDALTPVASGSRPAIFAPTRSSCGNSNCGTDPGSMRSRSASCSVTSPSSTMSAAMRTRASAPRLPLRVCSM